MAKPIDKLQDFLQHLLELPPIYTPWNVLVMCYICLLHFVTVPELSNFFGEWEQTKICQTVSQDSVLVVHDLP